MSYHSVESLIDDLNGLNEESETIIDEIEHMRLEEEKVDEISNEYMHYDGEDKDLQRTGRKKSGTGVERLQQIMEVKAYNSVSKQLQFFINKDTCMKKQIQ